MEAVCDFANGRPSASRITDAIASMSSVCGALGLSAVGAGTPGAISCSRQGGAAAIGLASAAGPRRIIATSHQRAMLTERSGQLLASSCSFSTRRRILPDGVFGIASTNSTSPGTL